MTTRKRIRTTFVQAGGGGGAPPTVGNVAIGPDFGEGAGSDGVTARVGAHLTMPTLALEAQKTVGVHLTMPTLSMVTQKTVGAHLSGTALGAPFWQSESHAAAVNAVSVVVSKPTGTVAGDLLVAFGGATDSVGNFNVLIPTGWTEIRLDTLDINEDTSVTNTSLRSMYRVTDGTEGATFTFTTNGTELNPADHITVEIHRINGQHATTPIDANTGATLLASSLDPDPSAPAITTIATNCLVFAVLFHSHLALTQTHSPPASHVERTDFEATDATIFASTTATRIFAATGSQAAVEFNCTETVATDAIMQRIAIAPGTLTLAV